MDSTVVDINHRSCLDLAECATVAPSYAHKHHGTFYGLFTYHTAGQAQFMLHNQPTETDSPELEWDMYKLEQFAPGHPGNRVSHCFNSFQC